MDLFKFSDYRKAINELALQNPQRGNRTRMAEAASCSPSWMTRVMNAEVQLTPDQAAALADFFHLDELETDYLLLLVEQERAATPRLRNRIEKKITSIKKSSRKLTTAIKDSATIGDDLTIKYYSSWIYAAIHVYCMIKPTHAEDIAKKIKISEDQVLLFLKELREMSLIKSQGSLWQATNNSVHLPSDHPAVAVGHILWRSQTMRQLQENREGSMHYSAVHCLSAADADAIQAHLKEIILKTRKTITYSTSEVMRVFCVDWYDL